MTFDAYTLDGSLLLSHSTEAGITGAAVRYIEEGQTPHIGYVMDSRTKKRTVWRKTSEGHFLRTDCASFDDVVRCWNVDNVLITVHNATIAFKVQA